MNALFPSSKKILKPSAPRNGSISPHFWNTVCRKRDRQSAEDVFQRGVWCGLDPGSVSRCPHILLHFVYDGRNHPRCRRMQGTGNRAPHPSPNDQHPLFARIKKKKNTTHQKTQFSLQTVRVLLINHRVTRDVGCKTRHAYAHMRTQTHTHTQHTHHTHTTHLFKSGSWVHVVPNYEFQNLL